MLWHLLVQKTSPVKITHGRFERAHGSVLNDTLKRFERTHGSVSLSSLLFSSLLSLSSLLFSCLSLLLPASLFFSLATSARLSLLSLVSSSLFLSLLSQ